MRTYQLINVYENDKRLDVEAIVNNINQYLNRFLSTRNKVWCEKGEDNRINVYTNVNNLFGYFYIENDDNYVIIAWNIGEQFIIANESRFFGLDIEQDILDGAHNLIKERKNNS